MIAGSGGRCRGRKGPKGRGEERSDKQHSKHKILCLLKLVRGFVF